jgi:hypothetical protein
VLFRSAWKDFKSEFKYILDDIKRHERLVRDIATALHIEQDQKDSQEIKIGILRLQESINLNRETTSHLLQKHIQDRSKTFAEFKLAKVYRLRKTCDDIIEWLGASKSTVVDHDEYRRVRNQINGSGNWILKHEKMENWVDTEIMPPSSILLLTGIMGAGTISHNQPLYIDSFD